MKLRAGRELWLHLGLGASIALALIGSYVQSRSDAQGRAALAEHRPVERPAHGYVSSRECRSCHPQQYESWSHSYHRTMTAPATPEYVFGDFDGVALKQGEQEMQLHAVGDEFVLSVLPVAPAAEAAQLAGMRQPIAMLPPGDKKIALVTGSHHMQVYWYETGEGRALGQLPFAYLKEEARWIPRRMAFLRPPTKFRPAETGRWNNTCIHCHATHGQPLPGNEGKPATEVAELGVACEACHGPGRRHLARFTSPLSRYGAHVSAGAAAGDDDDAATRATDDLGIINPAKLDHRRASQVCSQCHAMWQFDNAGYKRWAKHGWAYRPGDDAEDSMWLFAPSRAKEDARVAKVVRSQTDYTSGQFWSDGQARVSGREFNGMTDSACFADDRMSCMSCHTMHKRGDDPRSHAAWADDQLGAGMDGDAACVQCHEGIGDKLTAHTKHAEGSSGSRCYNCHMPYTSYGLLKAIRSHKITNPSADETRETGRPNACNMCHLDRSLDWTARALETRFGVTQPVPASGDRASVGAAQSAQVSAAVDLALRGDAAQRALIAWALGWEPARRASGDAWMPAILGILMDDPYDAVRFIAHDALRKYPGYDDLDYDFVDAPDSRKPIAPEVAKRAASGLGRLPPEIPLDAAGQPNDTGADLLSRRNHNPINLLE